jgi:dolichol-phosphate mannosyltransferase
MSKPLISIISPVFNEQENLVLVCQGILKAADSLKDHYEAEIIFVNDGSTDQSAEVLERLADSDSRVKYVEFSRNFGKEIALSCGINFARGQAVIILDADLEHPPFLIPDFVRKWEQGAEVVIGIRKKRGKESLAKKLGSICFYKIMGLIGETKILSGETDFRLIDIKVANEFKRFTERGRLARGLIDWLGFKRDYLYFVPSQRMGSRPRYSFWKLVHLAVTSFVSHSLFPLKLAGYLGVFITLFAGPFGVFMFINRYFFHWLIFSGPAMLAVFNLFLIGIVLICLGLMALYIANIHLEVSNRPLYVVRKKKNF